MKEGLLLWRSSARLLYSLFVKFCSLFVPDCRAYLASEVAAVLIVCYLFLHYMVGNRRDQALQERTESLLLLRNMLGLLLGLTWKK